MKHLNLILIPIKIKIKNHDSYTTQQFPFHTTILPSQKLL